MKGLRGRLLRVNLADHSYEVEQIPDDIARKCLALLFRDAGPGYLEKVHGRKTDRMNGHIPVFVNSREARSPRGPDTHPEPGDTVTIMPPMAGGCGNASPRGVVEKVDGVDDRRFKS